MAETRARPASDAEAREYTIEEQAAIKAAAGWVNLFARTLKTCRLYDAANPTVARFRDELVASLTHLIEAHGTATFKITAEDVLYDDASMYPAKSRDDNLALPFYRDGIHSITFTAGIERRETDALIDAVLRVTGQAVTDDDLVTLLWEAQLAHIEMEYIPPEGELGLSGAEAAASPVPWPQSAEGAPAEDEDGKAVGATVLPEDGSGSRSDDWTAGDLTAEVEAAFSDLESVTMTLHEVYRSRHQREQDEPLVDAALGIANACLSCNPTPGDRDELARFLPRALRQTLLDGAWHTAADTVRVLRRCDSREWSPETFCQELMQPVSVTHAVERLDAQDSAQVREYIAFVKELGEPAVDVLNLALGESKVRRTRRALAEAITELCRNHPERLAPFLSDPRWYVVRNIIHILGWIGGPEIVGLLQTATRHPEPKVRHEVVSALGQIDLKYSRPMLVKMLEGADARLFSLVLHALSQRRDSATARIALGFLQDPKFEQRPEEEKRAIYSTLSATGNDEILPELEAELLKGSWFTRTQEAHRVAIARVIARMGSTAALTVLGRGVQSKRGAVRKACEEALAAAGPGHGGAKGPAAAEAEDPDIPTGGIDDDE
jgi:HEAT repeat protein